MMLDILDVATTVALLYVVAFGLFLSLGIMSVINLAHGAFMVIGAYVAVITVRHGFNPWLTFLTAPAIGLVVGAIVERFMVRKMYDRPLDTILATWGLAIVITQVVMLTFGPASQFSKAPVRGFVELGSMNYSIYRLVILGFCIALATISGLFFRYTVYGLVARSVILNETLARSLGVRVTNIRWITFSLGAAFAAFAGSALAPMSSVDPGVGISYLVPAFMIVIVAGPTLTGLAISTIVLGTSQTLVAIYGNQVFASITIVLAAVLLGRIFPAGLSIAEIRGRFNG